MSSNLDTDRGSEKFFRPKALFCAACARARARRTAPRVCRNFTLRKNFIARSVGFAWRPDAVVWSGAARPTRGPSRPFASTSDRHRRPRYRYRDRDRDRDRDRGRSRGQGRPDGCFAGRRVEHAEPPLDESRRRRCVQRASDAHPVARSRAARGHRATVPERLVSRARPPRISGTALHLRRFILVRLCLIVIRRRLPWGCFAGRLPWSRFAGRRRRRRRRRF